MIELADIFRRYGEKYREKYHQRMLPSHFRAMEDIEHCRTDYFGGHAFQCDNDQCAKFRYSYHSCRNRSCPKCHSDQTKMWLEKRRADLLPVTYFHVVFTVPQQLHAVIYANQKLLYGILMREAASALKKIALDPKYIGGQIGILAILHTWTRAMLYHPHVHMLVPGGGLSLDGTRWVSSRDDYLVALDALAKIFREKFRTALKKAELLDQVPPKAWFINWNVYAKPTLHGSNQVLEYLGRYVFRIAITNNRILSINDGQVRFRYKDNKHGWQTKQLSTDEFIGRFLLHVLPAGLSKVRYYGIFSPAAKAKLHTVKRLLGLDPEKKGKEKNDPEEGQDNPENEPVESDKNLRCPYCRKGHMRYAGIIRATRYFKSFLQQPIPRGPP